MNREVHVRFWESAGLRCPAPLTYLHAYASVAQARAGIGAWLHFYNEERLHQAHGYRTPRQIYEEQCRWTGSAAPNGSASPVSRARSGTGEMLTDGYGHNRKPAVL